MSIFAAKSKRVTLAKASLAALMLSSLAMFESAHALGTASGTDITNTATVNYTVGAVAQTAINSNTSTFKVDRKVDLTVVNNGNVDITTNPGSTNVAAKFTVTNTGNGTDNFTLAPANQVGDAFDVTNLRVYRDSTTTGPLAGVFDGSDTLVAAATPVAFTADQAVVFFIVSDIPLTATNSQDSLVRLTATTTSTATVGVDNPAAVDVVFADAGNDGTEGSNNRYRISAATLAVVKSAAVIWDPVNLFGANRKAIPNAIIEYTIQVTNSGGANATAVSLSDNIPANTTYSAGTMKLNAAALTDIVDADAGSFNGTAVNVNAGTVNSGGGTATVVFRVTVN